MRSFPSDGCRRRPWPCLSSANLPSAILSPKTTSRLSRRFRDGKIRIRKPIKAHGSVRKQGRKRATTLRATTRDCLPMAKMPKASSFALVREKRSFQSLSSETQRMQPPLLYDLTELQRHANRLFGFSAQETLDIAQALYERHKLISYPRTDSRHLSADISATAPGIVAAVSASYEKQLAART